MHARIRSSVGMLAGLALVAPASVRAQDYPEPQQYPPQPAPQYPQPQYPPPQYPPPQYPPPPSQYPEPAYPVQQYPQPGYGPTGQPPPSYYAPAPTPTYPPPRYAPPPPAPMYAPAPVPLYRQGFLWLPYVGANIPVGDAADIYGTGFRLGALFGLNINSFLSLNAELCIDALSVKTTPGVSRSGAEVDFTFSPLFHAAVPGLEFVLGPKLGSFYMSGSESAAEYTASYSGEGLAYGFNAGVFLSLGRVALGGLLSYTGRTFENCSDCSEYGYTDHVFGLVGALMY